MARADEPLATCKRLRRYRGNTPPGTTSQRLSRVRCYVDLEKSGATIRTELLRFNGAVERDPAIDAWMKEHSGELKAIAHQWFEVMRKCGDEVRELLHDGCPV